MKMGGGRNRNFGRMVQMAQTPKDNPAITFADFSGGYDARVAREDVPRNGSPFAVNCEVDNKNRIVRAPGTSEVEVLTGHTPVQMAIHGNLDGRSELLLFNPPFLGVKQIGSTVWTDLGLPPNRRYTWTNFGGVFLFTNRQAAVYARQAESSDIETLEDAPPSVTLCGAFNRIFAGGTVINGNFEPLGIRWIAANSDYRDWTGEGSGYEFLLDDTAAGDRIVSMLPMGLDFMAIILRKAIWVGRRTNNELHPAAFRPQVTGVGTISEDVVQATSIGPMFLNETGVYSFDGNSAFLRSEKINPDLLPLDLTQLSKYKGRYNPLTRRYTLFTPTDTWIYDIDYERWYRRDLVAEDAAVLPNQVAGKHWADLVGNWASQTGTWADYAPSQSETADLLLLGLDGATTVLHKEDSESEEFFGTAMTKPVWEMPFTDGEFADEVFTYKAATFSYTGEGTVSIYLPDINGDFRKIVQEVLAAKTKATPVTIPFLESGMGVGAQIELTTGPVKISRFALDTMDRSEPVGEIPVVGRTYS
jgi:hypothetical protein